MKIVKIKNLYKKFCWDFEKDVQIWGIESDLLTVHKGAIAHQNKKSVQKFLQLFFKLGTFIFLFLFVAQHLVQM